MIRKYHNHKLQTTPWHREEEPLNHHETPGRQIKQILNKLKSRGFLASGLSTYDFSTLYTTLPHNLIKEKLTEVIEQTFNREDSLYLACNDKNDF